MEFFKLYGFINLFMLIPCGLAFLLHEEERDGQKGVGIVMLIISAIIIIWLIT